MTADTRAGGRSWTNRPIGCAFSLTIFIITPVGESASNGRRPLNSSYITTPAEKMSDRASTSLPETCSGDR